MPGRGLHSRSLRYLAILLFISCFLLFFEHRRHVFEIIKERETNNTVPYPSAVDKAVVIAKYREPIEWVYDLKPDWMPYIYSTRHPPEAGFFLRPSSRKGREATVYLDFLIEHYDGLPNIIAFVHASPDQWHNDVLGEYTAPILQNLRADTIHRQGYVNLRCTVKPGCPIEVNPHDPTETDIKRKDTRAFFLQYYMEIFGLKDKDNVPHHIGNVCCGQFVVSREQVLKRPKADYERMRQWIYDTHLDDWGIGWVFEKLWHIIFGMGPSYCPEYKQCRCDLFGWCGPYGPLANKAIEE